MKIIIIDDDHVNNFICRETIKMVRTDCEMTDFVRPHDGLDHIIKNYKTGIVNEKTILFLDLNMIMLTGWEFLEEFNKFDHTIKEAFTIYILSSSVDPQDKLRAQQEEYVKDLIIKPLTIDALRKILCE